MKGESMIKLEHVPHGIDEINEYYGNPDPDGDGNFNKDFWEQNMKLFTLPYALKIGWNPDKTVSKIYMHKKIGDAVVDALDEIGTYMSGHHNYLKRNSLDLYWGCFAFRFQREVEVYSTHSWGIAIDLNKHLGELGEKPEQPEYIVEAFKKRGFKWGGDWKNRPDGMHFQAASGY